MCYSKYHNTEPQYRLYDLLTHRFILSTTARMHKGNSIAYFHYHSPTMTPKETQNSKTTHGT